MLSKWLDSIKIDMSPRKLVERMEIWLREFEAENTQKLYLKFVKRMKFG